ncbi:MAG: FAD-dependent monooxygenase [Gemmatimonadota bacterium]|nr:FAD-dependent monooxygenase [Gemmatimonadota bacterium]
MTRVAGPYDLAIAGAGPVGLAVAIEARLRGLRPVVVERGSAVPDKACGEGIMPRGVSALERMGVRLSASECRPFRGIRYVDGDLEAEGRFVGSPGLGVKRTVLVRAMLARARELGAHIRFDCSLEEWEVQAESVMVETSAGRLQAAFLVGADGLRSRVRRRAGLERPEEVPGPRRRFGIRRHYAIEPWSDLVEVHLEDGAEAYVTPVSASCVGVAVLFSGPLLTTRGTSADGLPAQPGRLPYERLLDRFPALCERLSRSRPVDRARGAGPLRQGARACARGRVALVGDAGGYVDALTGQGLELGFASAEALADVLSAGGPLARYQAEREHLTRGYRIASESLLLATHRRWTRRALVRLLRAAPVVFDRAVSAL